MLIDLHMHSRYSEDGEFTPTQLVEQCFSKGLATISITDHNCARANLEAQAAAKEKGINYIPGIEIDCIYQDTNFHVLGYGIDYQSQDFQNIEKNVESQSFQASLARLTLTQEMGFNVTEHEMWAMSKHCYWQGTWTGDMFAELLLAKPEYAAHPMLSPYRPGGSRCDNPYVNFYWDYYAQGKPCYVEIQYPQMDEVIHIIHQNHGAAILAHPGVNLKGKPHLLDGILSLGMDGIESFSSYHMPNQAEYYYQETNTRKLLATCGSDFHGKTKPAIQLGGAVFAPNMVVESISKEITSGLLYFQD